jgi:ribosome production factor 2
MGKGAKRAARVLAKREPQLIEGPRNLLLMRGPSSSEILNDVVNDLALLKKPDVKRLQRKNDVRPFEEASSLEFLAEKNDCGAFVVTSHTKKRPHSLIMGRTFDGHVLDMLELGVVGYEGLDEFDGPKKMLGSPPCFVFNGEDWDRSPELQKLRSVLLGAWRAEGTLQHGQRRTEVDVWLCTLSFRPIVQYFAQTSSRART